jgi:hypothetical protein
MSRTGELIVSKRFRPPFKLLAIALVLLILGFLALPITSKPPAKVTATTVLDSIPVNLCGDPADLYRYHCNLFPLL